MQYLTKIFVIAIVVASAMAWKGSKGESWRGNKVYRGSEPTQLEHHHKMPPFLKNVSEDARWEFYAIVKDLRTSMNEKIKKVESWAKEQGVEKEVQQWFKNIEKFWEEVNKKTTKVLDELPSVYPKVYKIMSDKDLTPKELFAKIRELKLDHTVAWSLHAVAMAVIHDNGHDPYMTLNADDFFGKLAGGRFARQHFRHHYRN